MPAPLEGEIILPGRRSTGTAPPSPPAAKSGALLIGVMAAALLGVGAAGGFYLWDSSRAPDPTATVLSQMQQDLGTLKAGVTTLGDGPAAARQDEAIRVLRKSVDTLKAELDSARGANASMLAQLNAKLDKADRDASGKLIDIPARLDKPDPSAGQKLADLSARIDRIERQVSSPTPTASIAPAARAQALAPAARLRPMVPVQQVAAAPIPEKPQKPATLANWIVRDVYDGIALVEGRAGGIREVTPGESLPGAGEVRAIQRRGNAWIVVTSRGIIDDSTW